MWKGIGPCNTKELLRSIFFSEFPRSCLKEEGAFRNYSNTEKNVYDTKDQDACFIFLSIQPTISIE